MEAKITKILREYPSQFADWKSSKETEAGIKEIVSKVMNEITKHYEPTVAYLDISKLPTYPLDRILRLWSDIVKIDFNILYGKSRRQPIITFRQAIIHFLWENKSTFKFTIINLGIGIGVTHATCLNSHKRVAGWLETDAEFRKVYNRNISELKELLKNRE